MRLALCHRPSAFAALLGCLCASTVVAQNQGLKLANGTTTYVDVPYAATLAPKSGITIEAWVTYDSSTLGTGYRYPTIVRGDPTPNQSTYFLRVEAGNTLSNRILFWVTTPSGNYTVGWNFSPGQLLTWTHLAATYDGAVTRIFVNGVQMAQGVATGPLLDRGQGARIGCGDLTVMGGETWNGEIDEVRIWPVARSAAAIAAAMNHELGLVPGEVSTWNLNGNAMDSSGTNHGTLVNSPPFATNTLTLTAVPFPGGIGFGNGSGCTTTTLLGLTSAAKLGNAGFGVTSIRAPASVSGLLALSAARLVTAFQVIGIDLWIDLLAPNLNVPANTNALGTATSDLPIPANPALLGVALYAQGFWPNASCTTAPLLASNGFNIALQQ